MEYIKDEIKYEPLYNYGVETVFPVPININGDLNNTF